MDFCFQILNSLLFCNINKKEKIKATLLFDESLDFVKINSDELRIKQIVLNLISNAVKFTNEGEIKLKCKKKSLNGILYVRISITDSGKGIKEEDKVKLFNDFVMLEPSKNEDNKFGSGLGLSICKNIAEKLNLILDFKSDYGKGSKFLIYIPCNFDKGNVLNNGLNEEKEKFDEYDSIIMNERKSEFTNSEKTQDLESFNKFYINKNLMFDLRTFSDNYRRKFCPLVTIFLLKFLFYLIFKRAP